MDASLGGGKGNRLCCYDFVAIGIYNIPIMMHHGKGGGGTALLSLITGCSLGGETVLLLTRCCTKSISDCVYSLFFHIASVMSSEKA